MSEETYDLFQKGRENLRNGMAAQATVSLEKAKKREPQSRSIREARPHVKLARSLRPRPSSEGETL